MKTKQLFLFILLLLLVIAPNSCAIEYSSELNELRKELNELKERVDKLEDLCKTFNSEITNLKTIVIAVQNNDYISNYSALADGSGYQITFAKGGSIVIKHGINGTNGKDGKDGANGTNAPIIGVAQEGGVYYWTITTNGSTSWLTGNNGIKLRVTGENGTNGTNGADGYTPVMGVDAQGYWTVTTGNTTQRVKDTSGKDVQAVGKDGTNGTNGTNGKDGINGTNGKDGDSFFKSVVLDGDKLIIILNDSTVITIPIYPFVDELLTVHVATPGTLWSLLTLDQKRTTRKLKITGTLNQSDILTIDSMIAIEFVDFSEVIVSTVDFIGAFSGGKTDPAYGNRTIREVILPPLSSNLSYGPFNGCRNLETVTFTNSTAIYNWNTYWNYEMCTSLQRVIFSPTVTEIGGMSCRCFPNVDISSTVQKIHNYAFYCASHLLDHDLLFLKWSFACLT